MFTPGSHPRFPIRPRRDELRGLFLALACGLLLALPACKDDSDAPPPPDDDAPAAKPAIRAIELDPKRCITIKGDRPMTIANLVFVLQGEPGSQSSLGITLMSSRPGVDGARMTFGSIESAKDAETLLKEPIRFAGGTTLDPGGSGIFTTLAVYQPKFASIKLTSMSKEEVEGVLSGEFYRFSTATPTARPSVVKLEGSFIAAFIKK